MAKYKSIFLGKKGDLLEIAVELDQECCSLRKENLLLCHLLTKVNALVKACLEKNDLDMVKALKEYYDTIDGCIKSEEED